MYVCIYVCMCVWTQGTCGGWSDAESEDEYEIQQTQRLTDSSATFNLQSICLFTLKKGSYYSATTSETIISLNYRHNAWHYTKKTTTQHHWRHLTSLSHPLPITTTQRLSAASAQ